MAPVQLDSLDKEEGLTHFSAAWRRETRGQDGLSAIVEASETHVNHLYVNRGTSIDLYKFRKYSNQQGWKHGHIFHGSNREDLSFEGGMIQDIKALDNTNTREAMFLVKAANQWVSVEDTMVRSSTTLNHIGILKPFVGGFNTQISEVVCGFTSIINSSLTDWLTSKQPSDKRTSIPVEVQQLISNKLPSYCVPFLT
ncbi:hypothetical protein VPH35_095611 [Triticum aestivum]